MEEEYDKIRVRLMAKREVKLKESGAIGGSHLFHGPVLMKRGNIFLNILKDNRRTKLW